MTTKEISTLSITTSDQDLLGRENIVTAITNKIVERSQTDIHCEVIGVYSKWGEGKTSVLNLVKEQLKIQKKDKEREIRCVDFNPWLFKDQESLLLDFFKVLQKGVTNNDVKEKLKQYGPLVALGAKGLINIMAPGIGAIAGDAIEKVIKSISNVEIDVLSLKKEIDDQIKLANEHYLIFIDDVDRLDKDELHALFKLIRQNADFVNTTYIIAMDVDMVAKSIGHRFEEGCTEAGKNFLEKIVQYPVHLPVVQRSKMKSVFDKIILTQFTDLYSDEVGVTMQPIEKLEDNLMKYVFPLFSTVREMILYRNAISFILPSLYREVNLSDLAMLMALKQFYQTGYYAIRQNNYLLTGKEFSSIHYLEDRENKIKERTSSFLSTLKKEIEPSIAPMLSLLIDELFYPLNKHVYLRFDGVMYGKRLCSIDYFDNYFLYELRENKVSDVEIETLINALPTIALVDLQEKLEHIIAVYSSKELDRIIYQVLHYRQRDNLQVEEIDKVCVTLSQLSVNSKLTQFVENPFHARYDIIIVRILKDFLLTVYSPVKNKVESCVTIISNILDNPELCPFHIFFITQLYETSNSIYLDLKGLRKVVYDFTIRYIEQNSLESIFDLSMMPINAIFKVWKLENPEEYNKEIEEYMFNDNFKLVQFLQRTVNANSSEGDSYKTSTYNNFNSFYFLFDADRVYEKVKDIERESVKSYDDTIGYFIQRYNEQKSLGDVDGVITSSYSSLKI